MAEAHHIAGTLSDSQYSEVPPLFTGAQEELLNTPKPGGFGLSLCLEQSILL